MFREGVACGQRLVQIDAEARFFVGPEHALARLGTVRYRFQCTGLAFLPDGETVVSTKEGGAIQLWEARTGRLIREIDPKKPNVLAYLLDQTGMTEEEVIEKVKRLRKGAARDLS